MKAYLKNYIVHSMKVTVIFASQILKGKLSK
jgi:hypothetical protein